MGVYTHIQFLNENDPEFLKAKASPEGSDEREEWEDEYGPIEWRPGAPVDGAENVVEETEEEYGGWIIPLAEIPKDATHIVVHRG